VIKSAAKDALAFKTSYKGVNFFELHAKFEEIYTDLVEKVDEVAERILTLGYTPDNAYSQYLKVSRIKEDIAEEIARIWGYDQVEPQKVYDFIETELKEAIPELSKKTSLGGNQNLEGEWTQAGAASLLVRLYLNSKTYIGRERFNDCEKVAQDILDGKYGVYKVADRWDAAFDWNNETCDEVIFAFPGAIGTEYSEGCNNLIRDNGAALITSATDFVKAMGWNEDLILEQAQQKGIERNCFPELSAEEDTIVKTLSKNNDLQINLLSTQANIPISQLSGLLFSLEMKGVIRTMAGGCYHLIV